MVISSSQQSASVVVNTSGRARPVVTRGPVRTLRTDTGQIIRAGAGFPIGDRTFGVAFKPAEWAANRALGLNTMRVGVIAPSTSIPLDTLLNNIAIVVENARVNRMYVMLAYFAVEPGTWSKNLAANIAQWKTFWAAAGARFKDEPHVFYEMVNEPTEWGQVSSYTTAIKSGLRAVFDVMRAAAPNTPIVWPTAANLAPSAAEYDMLMQSFNSLGNGTPIDWNKAVLGHHYYNITHQLAVTGAKANATDGGEAGLRSLAAKYPLLSTETNWWIEKARRPLVDGLDLYERVGIGWTLLRRAGQTTPDGSEHGEGTWPLAPLFLENKLAQLRRRGFAIPVE
jgi:hypothetical protein